MTPAKMAKSIQADLKKKESKLEQLVGEEQLIKKIFSNTLTAYDISRLTEMPFGLYAYRNDTISFWNNNKVLADCVTPSVAGDSGLYQNERGKFVRYCMHPDYLDEGQELVVLFPIVTIYPYENNYLHSSFEASDHIPLNTVISPRGGKASYPIMDKSGSNVFYVRFNSKTLPVWEPGTPIKILIIIALFFSVLWFQLLIAHRARSKSFWSGFVILLTAAIAIEAYVYIIGLPFNIDQIKLFKPQLYASSSILPSLGHLLLNAMICLWLVAFIIRHARVNVLKTLKLQLPVKLFLAVVVACLMILCAFGFINVISTLVTDSKISFDVSHFYTISTYTLVGLLIVSIITTVSFLIIYVFSLQLTALVDKKWLKYIILTAVGVLLLLLSDTATDLSVAFVMLLWLLIFIVLLDIRQLSLKTDLFAPQMIFWAAFVIAFCTGVLQYFNYLKERDARIRFAEEVVQQRDDIAEYTFRKIGRDISKDPIVIDYLRNPSRRKRAALGERFEALYLGGHFSQYESNVLIFNRGGWSLYNEDTLSYNTLNKYVANSMPTLTESFYYRKNASDGHYYVAQIPVEIGDTNNRRTLGYVYIDFAVKESTGETVYPELLQPGSVRGDRNIEGYSYGVYVNNRLITQTSDYNFPVYLQDTVEGEYTFKQYSGSSELIYEADEEKTVIVIRYHRLWLEAITLFSYLFGIQMLVFLISALYSIYLRSFVSNKENKIISFTLRRRIHISFLGIVFISFIIIGIITIVFFTYQYRQNSVRKQQLIMQLVERATLQYLRENDAFEEVRDYNAEVKKTRFKYFITGLSNAQKIDINLYHASGVLSVTSQEGIYDRSLFARIIQPEAYHELAALGKQFLIQEEQIGQLNYISCYKPIRNKEGVNLGYLSIPFFSSEKELNYQISSIVVGLINLYAFVFLLSGVLTVFITRWITKSLSIVIKSFSRFSLSKNEPVDWPYDDEIGLLVREYNRMVKKAEENAKLLAQSEREGAWREMAKQVAHEIKNPLTPMKLNIQYLQQALRNDYPNVEELAKKVSESLIEQIENLSYIASEFSNFAKMPEARPEKFDLNDLLQRTVDLYRNQSEVTVHFTKYDKPLMVYTDKSQLLRVFNNLLENAVQAIPEDREGSVEVSLRTEGDEALIAFRDNGKGIEEDAMSKIFQPYFTTKSSGTGLGLAMTKKIIEFWKGTIRFETTPGEGTTFYITVPVVNDDIV